ncbi:unnamed protein product [Ectocarpus sp. 8 AP-2014]
MFGSNKGNASTDARQPLDQQQFSKKASLSYMPEMIQSELDSLSKIQTSNNEEIKKRLTEIQTFRENNLVVVGAIGGLKKLMEKM